MNLSDRLRDILAPPSAVDRRPGATATASIAAPGSTFGGAVEQVLGGEWCQQGAAARCLVVERRTPPGTPYGDLRVGEIAARLACAAGHAPLLTPARSPAQPPFLFFDIETTGLSGGAGTYAFLVGCGWFCDDGGFLTRQYLLASHNDERPMLERVAEEIARAGALVTFNGKSFDAPVVEMRYLFHRLEWIGGALPHLDVLHPARLFWGGAAAHQTIGADRASCSLVALEEKVLGAGRTGDVPGFEIPARYFQYLRSGDARPLDAVLEHNRLDLLTLAALAARLLQLVEQGPDQARNAHEALALGRVYQRGGLEMRAVEAFERAMAMSVSMRAWQGAPVRVDALRALALAARRARRHDEAAACWHRLLEIPLCPPKAAREALEALAVHHEHRVRDLGTARTFALESLNAATRRSASDRARHRLARLERKLSGVQDKRADRGSALFTP